MNLSPIIDSRRPNTIEFRGFNGTLDYQILRENVMLAGSHIQSSKMYSISSDDRIETKLKSFFERNLSEKEKLIRYLNFVFGDKDEYKAIFYNRWASKVGRNRERLEYISNRQYVGDLSYKKQYEPEKIKDEKHIDDEIRFKEIKEEER